MNQAKQLLSIVFGVFLMISTAQGQSELKRQKVTKEISMEIPENFTPMTQAELYNKYISDRKPIAMFTSPDKRADIGINENSSPWAGNDLQILKSFYKANISNLFTKVEFIKDEIQNIAGRDFVVLEFISTLVDENSIGQANTISKYTYIQYTIHQNKVLLFNFTSPALMQNQWQETATNIMQSVRIKQ